MSWLFFSLGAAFFWGIGQVLLKKGFSNLSPLWNILISAILNALIYIPFSLLNGGSIQIPLLMLPFIFATTTLYVFYFYAIEKGQISFAGTLFATYPLTTLLLSSIFLHERLSVLQLVMVFIIMLGCVLLSHSSKSSRKKLQLSWIAWALFGAVTTGAGDFLAKVTLSSVPLQTYNFYYPLMYITSFLLFWALDRNGRKLKKPLTVKKSSWTIVGVSFLTIGLLCLNYALSTGPVALAITISSSSIGLTVVLAYFFLRESVTKKQLIALSLIIIGIMGISFF